MLKWFGAALVILSGGLAGLYQARQFAARPRQIRELILALQRLETEISYGFTPLPRALERIGASMKMPLSGLFLEAARGMGPQAGLSVQESMESSLRLYWRQTSMKPAEREVIRQLSIVLGTSDRQDQMKHIALAASQLKHEEAAAREDQARYEKMSKSLGFLISALIVILIF
ncbi:stage III sporulation protein AB [Paenibacillus sp. F411]|uniref:Stage III sporulation protein AB n=1 Tax=Paenibacillus algicola TaxID=2565926 RepID=A0A4P8XJB6_9BACL|nr:stage III sporulation protein SpoIIIAB [Paenibacillus algicola]MBO2945124.1 stage III sporulation protein AB [Paenibacillus sp. F411]QCT02458.1 stage III sporulation protein AB [Paenibacillus algicola]